jgi:uncharacterized protein (TIGR00730 family)
MSLMKICVYCGSSDSIHPAYIDAARSMGRAHAAREFTLIYAGGCTGMMGALADSALEGGSRVIGVITHHLNTPHLAHPALTEMYVVPTMHERKALMAELADAFVGLPGGLGTFEEFLEILTWAQIGLHRQPVGILNARDCFGPLLTLIEHANQQGFLHDRNRIALHARPDPDSLLGLLSTVSDSSL